MRIVYGVHGYGRGHATRAMSVFPELARRHDVLILAGGDAYASIRPDFPVVGIPTLGYFYDQSGRRSNWLTLKQNAPTALDVLRSGPSFQSLLERVEEFRPDVVISDAELFTNRIAAKLGVPRISFDHFGIMAYCRPPIPLLDRVIACRDALVYKWLMGSPERVIVSSFYEAPPRRAGVAVVGPMLRDQVYRLRPFRGEHILVYLNNGEHQFTKRMEAALRGADCPVRLYGVRREGVDGNFDFRPPSNRPFLEDLAGCRAVISTAGNQLVGEAMHLDKPLLVTPEDCVEQRLNAAAVERMGIGLQARQRDISTQVVRGFLDRESEFIRNIRREKRDGRAEALAVIERFLAELAPRAGAPRRQTLGSARVA